MIASWTFQCTTCARVFDHFYEPPRPTTTACLCGGEASWASTKRNQIHRSHSGRKYGEFDPQFGMVIESYEHKQKLMKERGWEELPPETKEEIAEDAYNWEQKKHTERDPGVLVADSLEELQKQVLEHERIDRRLTGEASFRRPMMETFSPFGK
jgi:hypothetical protein